MNGIILDAIASHAAEVTAEETNRIILDKLLNGGIKNSTSMTKRVFDASFAFILIVALGIPILMIALIVRLTSPGPVLYWSNRVGKDNSIFSMPKFRTMKVETPAVATRSSACSVSS